MRLDAHGSRALLGACLALLLALGWSAPAAATEVIGRWRVVDDAGHGWGLSLFEQPDPAFPAGWRLRLNAHVPGVAADHERPLRLRDGLGGAWSLANCSEELVPPGERQRCPPARPSSMSPASIPGPAPWLPCGWSCPWPMGAASG